jgi:hypothetical protein
MPTADAMPALAFLILVVGIGCLLLISFHSAGKRAERQFPQLQEKDIIFRERGVSATVMGRLAGASNALEVTVTRHELHIKGIYPIVTSIGEAFGMIHRVPLSDVISVSTRKRKVDISFKTQNKRVMSMGLYVRDSSKLKQALGVA